MTLTLKNINKSFNNKQVLKNISFTARGGEALGYLGRNGAGKTTTLRILSDIFRPDSGEIFLNEAPLNHSKIKLGYLPEERGLYPKSKVGEQMVYIAELRGMNKHDAKESAKNLLQELEAEEHWNKTLETLSKGNQQKIQLAIAVIHNPDIVILDEPFSGLDPVNAAVLKRLITRQVESGKIVLFSCHQMPYVEEFCEHVCIINKGEIVLDGKIKDIKRSYPRNRIALWPENSPAAYLTQLSQNPGWQSIVESTENLPDSLIITLKNPSDKAALYQLLPHPAPDRIQVIEPTLEDIFIEKAGDAQ